jgi:hypothetical protein
MDPTSTTRAGDGNLSAGDSNNGKAVINDADIPLVGIPLASEYSVSSADSVLSETSERASTAGDSSINGKAVQNLQQLEIAEKEERHVNLIRIIMFIFIVFSAVAVSIIVYFFARDYDKNQLELEVSVQEQLAI